MSSLMKDFLDIFFDLCREYQQEIPPHKMAEILREYADRLDEWYILTDVRRCQENIISKQNLYKFFKVGKIVWKYFHCNYL